MPEIVLDNTELELMVDLIESVIADLTKSIEAPYVPSTVSFTTEYDNHMVTTVNLGERQTYLNILETLKRS